MEPQDEDNIVHLGDFAEGIDLNPHEMLKDILKKLVETDDDPIEQAIVIIERPDGRCSYQSSSADASKLVFLAESFKFKLMMGMMYGQD